MTTTSLPRKARDLGAEGYSIASNRYDPYLLYVTRPDGVRYQVSLNDWTCSCPARVSLCSHIRFAIQTLKWADALRRRETLRMTTIRPKRHISLGHIRRMQNAPINLAPVYPPICLPSATCRGTAPDGELRRLVDRALVAWTDVQRAYHATDVAAMDRADECFDYRSRRLAKFTGHRLRDVQTAIRSRRGPCAAVVAMVDEIVDGAAGAEEGRIAA